MAVFLFVGEGEGLASWVLSTVYVVPAPAESALTILPLCHGRHESSCVAAPEPDTVVPRRVRVCASAGWRNHTIEPTSMIYFATTQIIIIISECDREFLLEDYYFLV